MTPSAEAACGFSFAVGNTYQVSGTYIDGWLYTGACSATKLTSLRIPRLYYPSDPGPNRQLHLEWTYPYMVGLALGVVTAAALLIWRRYRRTVRLE